MITSLKYSNEPSIYGNKALGLHNLMKLKLLVPSGFVISSGTDKKEIECYVNKNCSDKKMYVVRSSSNAEDSDNHSFAGLFDTIVGVKKHKLMDAIEEVMHMKNNLRIKEFCKKIKKKVSEIKVAVIIQEIVPSEISGVCFTKNPVTNKNEIYAEAILGQGEYLVSGEINPDSYNINKRSLKPTKIKIATQHKFLTIVDDHVEEQPVFDYRQKLSNSLLRTLVKGSLKVEKYYSKAMDIEFAVYKNKIYFLQARPITT